MTICVLKSKLHKAVLTHADLAYEGSITIDEALMDAAGLHTYEKVLIANMSNGTRLETYVIKGQKNSGTIGLNGAAARLGTPGDRVTILSFAGIEEKDAAYHKPTIIILDSKNRIIRKK